MDARPKKPNVTTESIANGDVALSSTIAANATTSPANVNGAATRVVGTMTRRAMRYKTSFFTGYL